MWSPTHVQVTVQGAKNLVIKGRGGTNDVFIVIQMGKDKFQTSIKEKTLTPEWHEECDLTFVDKSASIQLTVFHRNMLGLDEFLGQIVLPLENFDIYDIPRNRWYSLKGRPEKKDSKYRGELEVKVAFVSHNTHNSNSLDVQTAKKRRGSIKNLANAVGHKLHKIPTRSFSLRLDHLDPRHHLEKLKERRHSLIIGHQKLDEPVESDSVKEEREDLDERIKEERLSESLSTFNSQEYIKGKSERHETLGGQFQGSQITSSQALVQDMKQLSCTYNSSLSSSQDAAASQPNSLLCSTVSSLHARPNNFSSYLKGGSLAKSESNLCKHVPPEIRHGPDKKSKLQLIRNSLRRHTVHIPDSADVVSSLDDKNNSVTMKYSSCEEVNRVEHKEKFSLIPEGTSWELLEQYEKMSHEELMSLVISQQMLLEHQKDKIEDLETYIDELLVRVMETTPLILQTPYKTVNPAWFRYWHKLF